MIRFRTSVILPTYNEAGHILELVDALRNHVPPPTEIIVVDDASPDGTADLVSAMRDPAIRVLRRRERSLVTAIQAGIAAAQGDIVVWMDADFSHPPEVAGRLVELVRSKACDVAIGTRFATGFKKPPAPFDTWPVRIQKNASAAINMKLRRWLSPACSDWTSGFIAANAPIIKKVSFNGYYGDYFIRMVGELIMARARIGEIPYISPPRRSGKSKTATSWLALFRLAWHYLQTIRMTRKIMSRRTAAFPSIRS